MNYEKKPEEYDVVELADIVDSYCNDSFNDGRKYFDNLLRIVHDVWSKMQRNTLRIATNKILFVDPTTQTAKLPVGFKKLAKGVSVIDDCRNIIPIIYDPNKNVGCEVEKNDCSCGCNKCGCSNDSCNMNLDYTDEDIIINGTTYKKTIKTRLCENGDVIHEYHEPFLGKENQADTDSPDKIIWRDYTERIGNVTRKPCGCIEPTDANISICIRATGFNYLNTDRKIYHHNPGAEYGHLNRVARIEDVSYKIDLDERLIYFFGQAHVKKAKISFISTGKCLTEPTYVPDYCEDAIKTLLHYRSLRFRSNVSSAEKERALRDAGREEEDLLRFLYPLVPAELLAIERRITKW